MPATYTDRIDGLTTSVAVKAPVVVATTGALAWPLSGLGVIDSITLADGDRVLVKDQHDLTQNGIWIARATAWQRADDWDGARDAVNGTLVHQAASQGYWEAVSDDKQIKPGESEVSFFSVVTGVNDVDTDQIEGAGVSDVSVKVGKGYVEIDCSLGDRRVIFDGGNSDLRKQAALRKTNSETAVLTINDGANDIYPEQTQQRVTWRRVGGTLVEIARSQ